MSPSELLRIHRYDEPSMTILNGQYHLWVFAYVMRPYRGLYKTELSTAAIRERSIAAAEKCRSASSEILASLSIVKVSRLILPKH